MDRPGDKAKHRPPPHASNTHHLSTRRRNAFFVPASHRPASTGHAYRGSPRSLITAAGSALPPFEPRSLYGGGSAEAQRAKATYRGVC
jgi:hypothetical protein